MGLIPWFVCFLNFRWVGLGRGEGEEQLSLEHLRVILTTVCFLIDYFNYRFPNARNRSQQCR